MVSEVQSAGPVVSEVQSDSVWFQRYKVTVCGFRGTK